jgi:hypothetical protein
MRIEMFLQKLGDADAFLVEKVSHEKMTAQLASGTGFVQILISFSQTTQRIVVGGISTFCDMIGVFHVLPGNELAEAEGSHSIGAQSSERSPGRGVL